MVCFQREVPGVIEMRFGAARNVSLERFIPGGKKNDSPLPQTASSGGCFVQQILLNLGC